jgi:hypothetical protein
MLNHIFQKEYFEGILQHYMKSNPIEGKKKKKKAYKLMVQKLRRKIKMECDWYRVETEEDSFLKKPIYDQQTYKLNGAET